LLTISASILPELAPVAGLDETQQAYNEIRSCPLTPFENRLKVPIRAGEKNFHK